MRIAVLADIHSNIPALNAVLRDMERYTLDGIIIAGDLIGGPQPNETLRLLRLLNPWMIRGNSDDYVVQLDAGQAPAAWWPSKQWAFTRWTYNRLTRDHLKFLKALPEQRVIEITGTAPIRVVHGSPQNLAGSIYPYRDPGSLETAQSQAKEPVLICGHTHEQWKVERDGRLALNPGAICGPLSGFVGAQYALLAWAGNRWRVTFRSVPYDMQQVKTAYIKSGLLEGGGALARAVLRSIETGDNVAMDFVDYAYHLAAEARYENCEVVPDEIWDRADATFDW